MNAPAPRVEAIERADIWAYRPFIDGLRAISIIAVVGYHLGVPGFRGGIRRRRRLLRHLRLPDHRPDRRRRSKSRKFLTLPTSGRGACSRILPPYLLVIATCFVIAPFVLLTPGEFLELGREALFRR